jgi:hypothetical protein
LKRSFAEKLVAVGLQELYFHRSLQHLRVTEPRAWGRELGFHCNLQHLEAPKPWVWGARVAFLL